MSDHMIIDQDDDEDEDLSKKKTKAKRFNGLLEWVLDQEGHEFLVDIDRAFIQNKQNLSGLKEKLQAEMNVKEDELDDR